MPSKPNQRSWTSLYDDLIIKYAQAEGIDPTLLKAQMIQESALRPKAVSNKGAHGLNGLMANTVKDPGKGLRTLTGNKVAPFDSNKPIDDVEEGIRFGAQYLSALLKRYHGDETAALRAYNLGFTSYDEWVKKGSDESRLKSEAREYPSKVKSHMPEIKPLALQQEAEQGLLAQNDISYTTEYSNETVRQHKERENKDGSISTVYSKTGMGPDGKWYNVPGFDRDTGKDYPTDDAAIKAAMPDIEAGKVTPYPTVEAALEAAAKDHEDIDMPNNPQAGLFSDLFNKSGDELTRIEKEEAAAAKLKGDVPAPPPEESAEDAKIRERVRQFRIKEGKNPDTGKTAGLVAPGEFDEFALNDEMVGDPMLHHLQGDEAATPEEERQLQQVVAGSADFIYGEGMPAVIKALNVVKNPDSQGNTELYQVVSNIAYQILKKEHARIQQDGTTEVSPAVFFAETGATTLVIDQIWDLAKQLELPTANDNNQYAGAVINTFKMAGEGIVESGDQEAMSEVEELTVNMAMTKEDGSQIETADEAGQIEQFGAAQPRQKPLTSAISTGLLGDMA